jgi:hypothetical protein
LTLLRSQISSHSLVWVMMTLTLSPSSRNEKSVTFRIDWG